MTNRIISEQEFYDKLCHALTRRFDCNAPVFQWVTGPGRSGAIASVYASHLLNIPFVPYGQEIKHLKNLLIIDTATQSGRTLRKAAAKYSNYDVTTVAVFHEPPRVKFWYEDVN